MQKDITLKEALAIIHSNDMLNLQFVKFDKKRGTGGEIVEFIECKKVISTTTLPKHQKNFTFDVQLYVNSVATEKIQPIHVILILKINGRKLIL
jgi:hypothetical protein